MLGRRGRHKHTKADAELNITSFMNLMIVLVPVLLMMMVFSLKGAYLGVKMK